MSGSLTESGAAVHPPAVRGHDGGFTQYRAGGGEVRSRGITEDALPLAGLRPGGGPLPALLAAVSAEFGPRLAADLALGVPDLDAVERALREASPGGGAEATGPLPGRPGRALLAPECGSCGQAMVRRPAGKRSWLTRLGRVEVRRGCFRCSSCGGGRFPLDRALGLEADTFTPGVAGVVAGTVSLMGFGAAAAHIADLAGLEVSPGSLQRRALAPGAEAMESGREEVVDGRPLESRVYLSVDGTGIPMRAEEVKGVAGKRGDGSVGTRGGGWRSCTPSGAVTGRPGRRRGQGQRTGRLPDRQRGGYQSITLESVSSSPSGLPAPHSCMA